MKWALVTLAVVGGVTIAVQAAVNAKLRLVLGNPMQATLISFTIGTLGALLCCAIMRSPIPSWDVVKTAPLWAWTGGILGLFFVCTSIVVAGELGTAALLSLAVSGQMLTSLLIDHYGWFNMTTRTVDPYRIVGMILVVIGATLVSFGKSLPIISE